MAAAPPSDLGGADDANVPQSFVNNQSMRMIRVKGGAFGTWTPSVARHMKMMGEQGGKPDMAFALNRPAVPIGVELKDFYLSEFPVTNKMYREFVQDTGRADPSGYHVNFYGNNKDAAVWHTTGFGEDDLQSPRSPND